MRNTITNVLERHTLFKRLAARQRFYTAGMMADEKIIEFMNRVKQLAPALKSMNVTIDDKELAMTVLNRLLQKIRAPYRCLRRH